MTIDHFKSAIVDSLQEYSRHISDLKVERMLEQLIVLVLYKFDLVSFNLMLSCRFFLYFKPELLRLVLRQYLILCPSVILAQNQNLDRKVRGSSFMLKCTICDLGV